MGKPSEDNIQQPTADFHDNTPPLTSSFDADKLPKNSSGGDLRRNLSLKSIDDQSNSSQEDAQEGESAVTWGRSTSDEREDALASSQIHYVISYRFITMERFKDQAVEGIESLEPKSTSRQVQGKGFLKVTRIVYIAEMRVDASRPLSEQDITINVYGPCELTIDSIPLIHALYSVVEYYPGYSFNTPSLKILEPYAILYQHREALEEYASSASRVVKDGDRCKRKQDIALHMRQLLDFLDERPEAGKVRLERERYDRPKPVATFEMLWMLFPPGTDVFCDPQQHGSLGGYVVQTSSGGIYMNNTMPFNIHLWYLDYNGRYIGRQKTKVTIQPFQGEKEINSLPVIPCKFYERDVVGQVGQKSRSLRKQLIDYGEKFLKLTTRQCIQYSGKTYSFPRRVYDGRTIIDMEGYYYEYPEAIPTLTGLEFDEIIPMSQCSCSYCESKQLTEGLSLGQSPYLDYDRISPHASSFTGLKEHQKFLCTRRVWGLVLNIREWQKLDIANVSDCQWNSSMIDNQLSIDNEDRDLIKGLVKRFVRGTTSQDGSTEPWAADFIPDKGDNQIFLLHGKPGVGKTLTSECVAEFVQRPLLALNCSDIGISIERIEDMLQRQFKRAKLWGAVLLLNEADVYLEQRLATDLQRNCLVAAFLRALEYYHGVLFLTTNRVGVFDDAMLSRIQIVLHYEFDEAKRRDVWDMFFRKLERERGRQIKVPYSTREYARHDPELATLRWNGREIRNASQTAVALAEYKNERDPEDGLVTLQDDHFRQVVKMSANFREYMCNVHGAETEKMAATRKDRNEYSKEERAITSRSSGLNSPTAFNRFNESGH